MALLKRLNNIHLLSLMGTGSVSVFNFVFTLLLYRSLPSEEAGIWFFFQTTLNFLDMFRQGFLSTAFVKFYAGSTEEKKQQIIGSTWYILGGITLVAIGIDLLILPFISNIHDLSVHNFVIYFPFNFIISLPAIIAMCIAQADLKFDRLLYIRLSQTLLLIISTAGLLYFKKNSLQNLMIINITSALLTTIICLYGGWTGIKFIGKKTKESISQLFNFGKFTVGTIISSNVFNVTNASLINFMLGPSYLAIYNLGTRLMEVVEIPLRSFVATAMPMMASLHNNHLQKEVIFTSKKYIGIITWCIIPFLLITLFFANPIIAIIGGPQYTNNLAGTQAANIFRLFVMFALLYPADRFLAVTLDVIHRPQVNLKKILIMLFANILIGFVGMYFLRSVFVIVFANTIPVIIAIIISYRDINKNYARLQLFTAYTIGFQEIIRISNKIKTTIFQQSSIR